MADTVSVTVAVKKGGKQLGTLEVSGDGLVWKRGSRRHKVGWDAIEGLSGKKPARRKAAKKRSAKKRPARKAAAKKKGIASLRGNTTLRGTYKGKTVTARTTAGGKIKLGAKTYASPTAAATAVVKSGRRNGWSFWHYKKGTRWVPVSTLR